MSAEEQPDWKSPTWLPTMTEHLEGMLQASREQLDMLGPALAQPYKLDDATVDRMKRAFQIQLDDLWLWEEQARRWREGLHGDLTDAQKAGVEKMQGLVKQIRDVDTKVLDASEKISQVTIDKLMAKSDAQVGLEALTGRHGGLPR
ncbi:hypothetical protein [Nocardiopsis sp. JB363]|uniref:hypothetical protein n=1 Tax=Nocardiopsis sp. JB363 TaxID=1434837 RepID=UPI00097AA4F9|nr:hypothetical protein [Nocardiopsis sp. JB363]SIO86148.1 hypothetical protein BQ8420_10535 [Nocardiopsis sp. JB363]